MPLPAGARTGRADGSGWRGPRVDPLLDALPAAESDPLLHGAQARQDHPLEEVADLAPPSLVDLDPVIVDPHQLGATPGQRLRCSSKSARTVRPTIQRS